MTLVSSRHIDDLMSMPGWTGVGALMADPSQNPPDPKKRFGMAKPSTRFIPPTALFELGRAMALGAHKYGPFNWHVTGVEIGTYIDAIQRHLQQFMSGEDIDIESQGSHLAHIMACCAILIDAMYYGKAIDDRIKHLPVVTDYLTEKTVK